MLTPALERQTSCLGSACLAGIRYFSALLSGLGRPCTRNREGQAPGASSQPGWPSSPGEVSSTTPGPALPAVEWPLLSPGHHWLTPATVFSPAHSSNGGASSCSEGPPGCEGALSPTHAMGTCRRKLEFPQQPQRQSLGQSHPRSRVKAEYENRAWVEERGLLPSGSRRLSLWQDGEQTLC